MHETCGWAERRKRRINAYSELVTTMGIVRIPPTALDAATWTLRFDPVYMIPTGGRQAESTDAVQPHEMPFDHLLAINEPR
jgi:hypothetical protein